MNTGVLISVVTVGGTLLLCGIVVWLVMKNIKKQAYQGVVTNKHTEEREGADDASYTVYTLEVKTDDGQIKRVGVGRKIWESFNIGDRIVKEAGKYNPTKAA